MKQLVFDLMTRCTPSDMGTNYIIYNFQDSKTNKNIEVTITIRYYSKSDIPKMELMYPFENNYDYALFNTNEFTEKKYMLSINNSLYYVIDFTPEEQANIDVIYHKIFKEYQLNLLNFIKNSIHTDLNKEPTPEENLSATQEQIISGNE